MRLLSLLVTLLLITTVAAAFTKPTQQDVEKELQAFILAELNRQDVNSDRNPLANAALIGCKLRPGDCYEVLRSAIDMTYEDRTIYARIDIDGFERHATCYGAFGRITCPGGLKQD